MRKLVIVSAALVLSGCGSTTGILPVGPGTYTITERFAPIRGGSDTAKTDALTQANAYCAQQGKQLMSTNMNTGGRSFELVFKCITADEAAASNYKVQTAPNIVIENR
jgi:putative hemolysin